MAKNLYECKAKIVSEVIFLGLYAKFVWDLIFCHCINNDTPFMNPLCHPHLSVNQQERSSSRRGARLRLSLKNVQWPSPPFPSFLESVEHQACWTKNSYLLETTIWVQEDEQSVSRSHETGSWQWSTPFRNFLSPNPPTNIQVWSCQLASLWTTMLFLCQEASLKKEGTHQQFYETSSTTSPPKKLWKFYQKKNPWKDLNMPWSE